MRERERERERERDTLENEIDLHINVISLHNITAKRAINNFDVVGR